MPDVPAAPVQPGHLVGGPATEECLKNGSWTSLDNVERSFTLNNVPVMLLNPVLHDKLWQTWALSLTVDAVFLI